MQYRSPVGLGPSLKTCPRWASHKAQETAVRVSNDPLSRVSLTLVAAIGFQKLGHPVPESYFVRESNRALAQQTQR